MLGVLCAGLLPLLRSDQVSRLTHLQRVLDALDPSPALIRTATWDVVAWNRGATALLMDYGSLPPEQRNAIHRKWDALTPEQRHAMREKMMNASQEERMQFIKSNFERIEKEDQGGK